MNPTRSHKQRRAFPSIRTLLPLSLLALLAVPVLAGEGMLEELKVKREAVYAFAKKPELKRVGDRVTIAFESKGWCDVTIVVEDAGGKIVRHLVSGVLGPNAPEPFKKNAKKQTIDWDGKNDRGEYVDDKNGHSIRVSLGLKPRFEKSLFWHPKKRNGPTRMSRLFAQPEGVYVYEGDGLEQVRLYGHDGEYIRTVHPFPADKIEKVRGLKWWTSPDGYKTPAKIGYWLCTFLQGGVERTNTGPGSSDTALAVNKGTIAVVGNKLTRLATDGTSGPHELLGTADCRAKTFWGPKQSMASARSAAFSPDNQYLYLTGFYNNTMVKALEMNPRLGIGNAVYRMKFSSNDPPERWLGEDRPGKDDKHFSAPLSLCVDAAGQVYVADCRNNRVQVFGPGKELIKSIKLEAPAVVQVHHKTHEIYVFSWDPHRKPCPKPMLRVLAPVSEGARIKKEIALSLPGYGGRWGSRMMSDMYPLRAVLDSWTDPPTLWMVDTLKHARGGAAHIKLYSLEGNKLKLKQDWNKEVVAAVKKWNTAPLARQRLYVDPTDGTLYVGEQDSGVGKVFTNLVQIDPEKETYNIVALPFSAEEMVIDTRKHCYLRTTEVIARYDMNTWREIPFDYGEERTASFSYNTKDAKLMSGLVLPTQKPVYWHQQGFDVNFNGDIAVFCFNAKKAAKRKYNDGRREREMQSKPYTPTMYPGRIRYGELHVFDKHGRVKAMDVAQGLPDGHGTCIDAKGNVYVLIRGARYYEKGKVLGGSSGTMAKFSPGKRGKLVTMGKTSIRLSDDKKPDRAPDVQVPRAGDAWFENAEWLYGGVGYCRAAPCQCWNCRFALDFLGRTFVPEMVRSQFAVLDTNGNLITRIGRYGNVDEGKPSHPAKREPPHQRSIGGDEVALMYAPYVATHTDRRLFIADPGNARILSVKLGYHASHTTPLKDVPDEK